jgi:hypothetical protein
MRKREPIQIGSRRISGLSEFDVWDISCRLKTSTTNEDMADHPPEGRLCTSGTLEDRHEEKFEWS